MFGSKKVKTFSALLLSSALLINNVQAVGGYEDLLGAETSDPASRAIVVRSSRESSPIAEVVAEANENIRGKVQAGKQLYDAYVSGDYSAFVGIVVETYLTQLRKRKPLKHALKKTHNW